MTNGLIMRFSAKRLIKSHFVFVLLTLQLWFPLLVTHVGGQATSPKHVIDSNDGAACELNSFYLDELIAEAKRSNERIFVISRVNKKEKYRLNQYRLGDVYRYVSIRELPLNQVVFAIGKRTSEKKGRLEFYLGSQLFLVSLADNGKPVCLTCCDTP